MRRLGKKPCAPTAETSECASSFTNSLAMPFEWEPLCALLRFFDGLVETLLCSEVGVRAFAVCGVVCASRAPRACGQCSAVQYFCTVHGTQNPALAALSIFLHVSNSPFSACSLFQSHYCALCHFDFYTYF